MFRGYSVGPLRNGKATFKVAWFRNRTYEFIVDTKTNSISCPVVLPQVDADLFAKLKTFLKSRQSEEVPAHRRIEQTSGNVLELNQGTLYPALLRLEQMGWITSEWSVSDANRRSRFYSITRTGRKQLAREAENWERISGVIARFLKPGESA